jgi:hypothetical protein
VSPGTTFITTTIATTTTNTTIATTTLAEIIKFFTTITD